MQVEVTGRDAFGNRCRSLETSNVSLAVEPLPHVMSHEMHKSPAGGIIVTITMLALGESHIRCAVLCIAVGSRSLQ